MIAADRTFAVVLKALVRLYQLTLSPFIGRQCRFLPTCSQYALDALETHGAVKGSPPGGAPLVALPSLERRWV